MDWALVFDNFLSPPILFFVMGLAAGLLKSDLAIPEAVAKLLSLYLIWAIGIKGGIKLRETGFTPDAVWSLLGAGFLATVVPAYVYAFLRMRRLDASNAAALCAVYGSVSAVTFLTASAFLTRKGVEYGGHMVAALALMESPAILLAVMFERLAKAKENGLSKGPSLGESLREAALNGPVVLLTGSMLIGAITGKNGHELLKPLYVDLFQGILTFFLLELGLLASRRLRVLRVLGPGMISLGVLFPIVNGALALLVARVLHLSPGNAFLLVVLGASASYIAAPAAIRHAIPKASPGIYLPLALAVTFPFNLTIGLPIYWLAVCVWWGVT